MTTTKRILTAAAGLPLLLAIAACNRGYNPAYDGPETNNVAATPPVNPPAGLDAAAPGAPLAAPVGIPTDKLTASSIPKMGQVVTDANGWVLYRFDNDTAKPEFKVGLLRQMRRGLAARAHRWQPEAGRPRRQPGRQDHPR